MGSRGSVLLIVQNLPVPFDRRVWLEALTLLEAGYTVSVISPRGDGDRGREDRQGIHLYRYPPSPEAHGTAGFFVEFAYCWLMTCFLSMRAYADHRFNVIHACNPPETYFLLAWLYRPLGVRFLFDHHDLSPEMYLAKGGRRGGWLHRGLLLLERLTLHSASVVLATNESHKRVAHERGSVPPEQIFVVRSGPDFERLRLMPPEPDLKEGRRHLVCYLGEMCLQDRVDILLQAASHLVRDIGRTDVLFVLLGGGPDLPRLRALCRELGLGSWVRFTGRVPDETVCRYLSTADVCAAPDPLTDWSDQSTMNKVMEYMTFAKPLVAFDLRETRVSARDAALYATPNDPQDFAAKIETLLDCPDQRQAMGQFARQRVINHLSWDHSKQHLLAAYERLLRG